MGLESLHILGKEKNPDLNFRAYTKVNFQWIRGASGMHKTIKL